MTPPNPSLSRLSNREHAGTVDLWEPHYRWTVMSDCGVVKVYSTRDGCMVALNPQAARRVAREFSEAMERAADMTEVRSCGKVISRAAV